jgi:hypothetical protein
MTITLEDDIIMIAYAKEGAQQEQLEQEATYTIHWRRHIEIELMLCPEQKAHTALAGRSCPDGAVHHRFPATVLPSAKCCRGAMILLHRQAQSLIAGGSHGF